MKDLYYTATKVPTVTEFGPRHYLTASGVGAPESPAFAAALKSLYPRAYAARKISKFQVGKLEGQWWAPEHENSPREEWNWKLLIQIPFATDDSEIIDEGPLLQMLHIGPFSTEPETLAQMHAYMHEHGLVHNGLHHEVYLSDFRRTPPERGRTILRQPVRPA